MVDCMKGFLIAICLIVMGIGIFLGVFADDFYKGKETFHTEQEYTLFKEAISDPDVHITSLQSLSSNPPIIVNFDLRIPKDMVFPYGEKDNTLRPSGYGLAGFSLIALCYGLFRKKKEGK